jgi:hypothetical protein
MVLSYDTGHNQTFVLKILNMELDLDYEMIEMVRMDALVMESLTSSPRIVNIYGHCSTSVATEDMVSFSCNICAFTSSFYRSICYI